MACPRCGCQVHYQYDTGHDPAERCASCGKVFYPEEAADDEDDEPWPFTGCSGPLTDCDMEDAAGVPDAAKTGDGGSNS
jgi:hypothetical protein